MSIALAYSSVMLVNLQALRIQLVLEEVVPITDATITAQANGIHRLAVSAYFIPTQTL
jgi:hypothetical protein